MKKVEEEDYERNDEYFCYCYKSKRNLKWFDNFIKDETQFKFFPLLVEYFIIQINTIVFEIKFDENNDEGYYEFINVTNILIFIVILIVSLFLFFYMTISFGRIFIRLSEGKNIENPENKIQKIEAFTGKLSNKILNGTYGIIIFNGFYSFIVSLICLSKDVKIIIFIFLF